MKRRTLTSNILSLIKRNIPSICTVLILSSPEPRKRGSVVIYAHCPALLIGLLGWSLGITAFLCVTAKDMDVQRAWKGAAGGLGGACGAHSRPLLGLWLVAGSTKKDNFLKITIWQVFPYSRGFVNRANVYEESSSSCCHGCDPPPVPCLPLRPPSHPQAVSAFQPHPFSVGGPPSWPPSSVSSHSIQTAHRLLRHGTQTSG